METIIVKVNPQRLANPDLDLRYAIPDRIGEVTQGVISDNGYDYLEDSEQSIGIWLAAESSALSYPAIVELFREEMFLGNDLSKAVEIYISANDTEDIQCCKRVYP